jgi:hypothetical protein
MKGADMAGPEFQARLQKALDLYAKVLEREPSNYMAKMNTCCMSIRRRASPAQVQDCAAAALALSYRSLNLVRCVGYFKHMHHNMQVRDCAAAADAMRAAGRSLGPPGTDQGC